MGFLLLSGGTPAAAPVPNYTVMVTAYNAVPGQTDDSPYETASGAYSNPEVVAARSRDLAESLPFGTIIAFDGSDITAENTCGYNAVAHTIGYRVIEDSMNPRYTSRIDVLFDTKHNYIRPDGRTMNAANILGICKNVRIRVVGHVDINHIPQTQKALAALVRGNSGTIAIK